MIKVTDPNLLAQLEGYPSNSPISNNMQKVTDPALLSQLEAEPEQNFANKIINNPLMQALYGAGDSFTNALSFGKLGNAARNIGAGNPESLSYKLGELAGDVGAAAIPSALATKAIRLGMLGQKAIPYANTLGNAIGGAEWGFAAHPGSRLSGAAEGAAIPLAFAGAGKALKYGKKLTQSLVNRNPAKFEQELIKRGTEQYLEDVARPSSNLYKEIEAQTAGKGMTFRSPTLDKLIKLSPQAERLYKDPDIKPIYENFAKNKGYIEAKNLKSSLGDEYNSLIKTKLKEGSLNTAQKQKLRTISEQMETLDTFINEHLSTFPKELNLLDKLKEANLLHRTNVVPARNAAKIINEHVDTLGNVINKKRLINSLEKASSKPNMLKRPIPQEVSNINKLYEENLTNKENLRHLRNQLLVYGLPATLGGSYLGHHISKYLTGVHNK